MNKSCSRSRGSNSFALNMIRLKREISTAKKEIINEKSSIFFLASSFCYLFKMIILNSKWMVNWGASCKKKENPPINLPKTTYFEPIGMELFRQKLSKTVASSMFSRMKARLLVASKRGCGEVLVSTVANLISIVKGKMRLTTTKKSDGKAKYI